VINFKSARNFCSGNIEEIENYYEALESSETWHIHHRDEVRTLPSGMVVYRSVKELKENGRYFHCPANELIFLTHSAHSSLHQTAINKQRDYSKTNKESYHTPEFSAKLSNALKGRKFSESTIAKMKEACKKRPTHHGWHHSDETKKKLSELHKNGVYSHAPITEFGKAFIEKFHDKSDQRLYRREYAHYRKYGTCSWLEEELKK
jgi:hypothetical protein